MRYKAAIFDMDGTILDTLEDLHGATNTVLEKYSMPARTLDEVRTFVGNGIHKLVERAARAGTAADEIDEMTRDFLEYYKAHSEEKTHAYEGIEELLRELSSLGIKTACNSNKAEAAVKTLVEKYFPSLFDLALGEVPSRRIKPAPDGINEILRVFGVSKEEVVYIGDSDVDFNTAKNAGVDFIGVDWGFKGEVFLRKLGATKIAKSASDVKNFIL